MPDKNIQGLLSNPLLHMGLGLLANDGRWGGLLTGINSYNTQSQQAQQAEIDRSILQQQRIKQEQAAAQQQQAIEAQRAQQEAQRRIAESLSIGQNNGLDQQKLAMLNDLAVAQPDIFSQMAQQQLIPKQPDYPSTYDSYLLAQKNPDYGRFLLEQQRAGATNVNLAPKLPAGYQWVEPGNPDLGVEPIKGSEKDERNAGTECCGKLCKSDD